MRPFWLDFGFPLKQFHAVQDRYVRRHPFGQQRHTLTTPSRDFGFRFHRAGIALVEIETGIDLALAHQ